MIDGLMMISNWYFYLMSHEKTFQNFRHIVLIHNKHDDMYILTKLSLCFILKNIFKPKTVNLYNYIFYQT